MYIRLKKNAPYRFYLLLSGLIFLLFVRYGLEIDIPRFALTSIILLIAALGTKNEVMAIALCCIPLHEAVDFYTSLAGCTIAYTAKNTKYLKIDSSIFLLFLMMVWELTHGFTYNFSLMTFIVSFIPLIFLMVTMSTDVSDLDYRFIIRNISIVLLAICIILLVNHIIRSGYSLSGALSSLRRLGIISEGEGVIGGRINPNTLGIICVLTVTGYLQLYIAGRSNKTDLYIAFTLLAFGILTSSRTFLACLLLMTILMIAGHHKSIQHKIKFFCIIIVLAVLAMFLINLLLPDLFEYYIGRFSDKDITTGRWGLMGTYHEYIISNPSVLFWGNGLNSYAEILINKCRMPVVPHNCIQEIVIAWGLPGLLMVILLFYLMITKSTMYDFQKNMTNYIPLIIIVFKSQAGQLLTSGYTLLALAFAYLSLCQNFKIKNIMKRV